MQVHNIVYASTSTIPAASAVEQVHDIVIVARARNLALDVTGALLFSESRFAQLLEGPAAAVATIMDSIRRDPRHCDMVVLEEGPVARRQFNAWSLAYAGPSVFISRTIARPVHEAALGSTRGVGDLIRLMREFTIDRSPNRTETGVTKSPL